MYEAARVVSYASDVTWREVGRVLRSRAVRPRLRAMLGGGKPAAERSPLAEGVVEQDGEVVLARAARPDRDPVLPLRAAAAAAQAGLPLSLHAVRRMAAAVRPLPTPWPAEAREQLVTLLGSGRSTIEVWEALEAEGLITRLLPDWERVRCRPQRNAVHIWTVDRHLIETAVRAAEFTRRVHRPDLLLVSALLHDIGKGWPGDHSVAGEIIARDVAARIGFDRADVAVLATLVRHHLLLVETATRRDLEDPATVRSVAEAVGSQGTLELLHALTEADALATGPAAWSSWRGSLVADLVKRVSAVLAGDDPEEPEAAAPTAEQERLAIEAARTGGPVLALRAQTEPPDRGAVPATRSPSAWNCSSPYRTRRASCPRSPASSPCTGSRCARPSCGHWTCPTASPGSVLLLDWRVAAEYGSLPQAARLRADLVRALDGSLDIAGRLAERDAAYPRRAGRRGAAGPGDRGLRRRPGSPLSSRCAPMTPRGCCTGSGTRWRRRGCGSAARTCPRWAPTRWTPFT